MDFNQRWLPNESGIASEVLDGEAIMLNLSNGNYYSLNHAGGLVWEEITRGASIAEVIAVVTRAYEVSPEVFERDLGRLFTELEHEGLVRPTNQPRSVQAQPSVAVKSIYEPPALTVYRDMNDLLALDPPMPGLQDIPWKDDDG